MSITILNIQALCRLCRKKAIGLRPQLFISNKLFYVDRLLEGNFYSNIPLYKPPWNVLFFGSDVFSAESLKLLCEEL